MKAKALRTAAIVGGKALLSGILVFLVLRKIDVGEVLSRFGSVAWFFPATALVCLAATLFLAARRWQVLSGGLLSYAQTLKYSWIGIFYSAILPGMVSGDLAKGASLALKNKDTRVGELPLSIAMDRAIGLYALLGFFVVSCAIIVFATGPLNPDLKRLGMYGFIAGAVILLLGICAVGVAGRLLGRHDPERETSSRLQAFLSRFFETLQLYRRQPYLLLKAAGYSVIIHCVGITAFYLVIRALHVDCDVIQVAVFYSMVSVLVSLPITISGLGLRDWFSLTFFQSLWGDGQAGVAYAWLALALGLILALVGAVVQVADLFTSRTTSNVG
jgi:glycosyltransferase 2 family protein